MHEGGAVVTLAQGPHQPGLELVPVGEQVLEGHRLRDRPVVEEQHDRAPAGQATAIRSTRIDPRWDAIVDATVALTATPAEFGPDEIAGLEAAGLDDLEVLDTILSGAFFNWANRLMLSIGEPGVPPAE